MYDLRRSFEGVSCSVFKRQFYPWNVYKTGPAIVKQTCVVSSKIRSFDLVHTHPRAITNKVVSCAASMRNVFQVYGCYQLHSLFSRIQVGGQHVIISPHIGLLSFIVNIFVLLITSTGTIS